MKSKIKMEKQYGLVVREILQNKDLSIDAKGLYVYLAARAGNKYTCYPTIATICKDLDICESTFHNLKNELIEHKIISITKTGTGFSKQNIYNLLIKANKGYGMVYLDTLTDSSISIKSKAIYGLIASFGGADRLAHPLVKVICKCLKICRNTYFKYVKKLKELEIINIKQVHRDGRFANCYYYFNGNNMPLKHAHLKYIYVNDKTRESVEEDKKLWAEEKKERAIERAEKKAAKERKDTYKEYLAEVKRNIEYEALKGKYLHADRGIYMLNNIVSVLTNTIHFSKDDDEIKIGDKLLPAKQVIAVFKKIKYEHVSKTINNIVTCHAQIGNLRAYLRTTLYNNYYQIKHERWWENFMGSVTNNLDLISRL